MFTVVWIDDDIPVLEDVISLIEEDRDRYRVQRVNSVKDAREHLALILSADLILLDILGPSGSETRRERYPGLELLKDLRMKHKFAGPVICFSVVNRPDIDEELKQYQVSDTIRKPVRPSELKRKVDLTLSKR